MVLYRLDSAKKALSILCCLVLLSGASAPVFAQAIVHSGPSSAGFHAGVAPVRSGALSRSAFGAAGGGFFLPGTSSAGSGLASNPAPLARAAVGANARTVSVRGAALDGKIPAAEAGDKSSDALGGAREAAHEALQNGETSSGASPAFDGAGLVAFRSKLSEPGVYLLQKNSGVKDDSLGRKLTSSLQPADIGAALKAHGVKTLEGAALFVTGVEMGSERDALKRVREAVAPLNGGTGKLDIAVLSVPRPWSAGFWKGLRDRVVYFLPSIARDYQAPLRDEVISGAATTLILELPNAFYLFSVMSATNAAIVLTVHTALLAAYTVWQRAMGNWILRDPKVIFWKQLLTGLPFVLNYNVLSRSSELASSYQAHGALEMLRQFPSEMLQFVLTQGLTIYLQTMFYSKVVIQGFRAWAASLKTPQDAEAARSWVNWLLLPWLWIDSIFLTQASTASTVLFTWTPLSWLTFTLTLGHVSLAALTAVGSIFIFYPALLDKTLPAYKRVRNWIGRKRGT